LKSKPAQYASLGLSGINIYDPANNHWQALLGVKDDGFYGLDEATVPYKLFNTGAARFAPSHGTVVLLYE